MYQLVKKGSPLYQARVFCLVFCGVHGVFSSVLGQNYKVVIVAVSPHHGCRVTFLVWVLGPSGEQHGPAGSIRPVCNNPKASPGVQSSFMYVHCLFLLKENYKIARCYFQSARTGKLGRGIPNSVTISLKMEAK